MCHLDSLLHIIIMRFHTNLLRLIEYTVDEPLIFPKCLTVYFHLLFIIIMWLMNNNMNVSMIPDSVLLNTCILARVHRFLLKRKT